MIAMLPLLMALQSAPPVPPPPADRVEAALALWKARPLAPTTRDRAVDAALTSAAGIAITDAKAKSYYRYLDPLRQRLKAHLPADTRAIDDQALGCLVEDMAWHLSADDLRAAKDFVVTPAGGRFWDEEVLSWERLYACYKAPVAFAVGPYVDAELAALGLKRPRPKGNLVN